MSRRRVGTIAVVAVLSLMLCSPASADLGGGTSNAESDDDDDTIGAEIETGPEVNTGTSGGTGGGPGSGGSSGNSGGAGDSGGGESRPGPRCTYTRVGETVPGAPQEEILYVEHCPTGNGNEMLAGRLVSVPVGEDGGPAVTVADLRPQALAEVSRRLPDPQVDMSPDPEVGGIVNLGLWLAADDPGDIWATVSVGPVWVTVTAELTSTTWEMGNGDVVECDGVGTPIPDPDTLEEGPCGYTYRQASTPDATGGDMEYAVTVTSHWTVSYESSSGGGGLDPIDTEASFGYAVREIQTVGDASGG